MQFIDHYLSIVNQVADNISRKDLNEAIKLITKVKKNKGRIFFLGVGGSAANCSHAVNDFRKLCNIECYSPIDNVSELTARINDDGFDYSFSTWLKISKINSKDLIFILSVGGGDSKRKISVNIIEAIKYAKKCKVKVLGIVGKKDGYTARNSNVVIFVPNIDQKLITPISESFQSIIWHLFVSHPELKVNKTKW